MKVTIYSDLHNEFSEFVPPETDADLIMLAGDIGLGGDGVRWANETFKKPVVYTTGNHEYYGGDIREVDRTCQYVEREKDGLTNFLQMTATMIGVRGELYKILGCTLWTDFNVFKNQGLAMALAGQVMNDYVHISNGEAPLIPDDTLALHNDMVEWLEDELSQGFKGKTIIMTHHAPCARSFSPQFKNELSSAAYASDLEVLMMQYKPVLWAHGHVHCSNDYMVGNTRVISNPRGYAYPYAPNKPENKNFNPSLVIEV